jgi:hypothetical protein
LGGLWFKDSPSKQFETPISKIIRAKWFGGVTQVVEYLLCKYKALSSKSSLTKKKKKVYCESVCVTPAAASYIGCYDSMQTTSNGVSCTT